MNVLRQSCTVGRRLFSTSTIRSSHVGSAPIIVPQGVNLKVDKKDLDPVTKMRMHSERHRNGKAKINLTQTVTVTGPKGELSVDIPEFVNLDVKSSQDNGGKARVVVPDREKRHQRQMWGTTRTLINNSVTGVFEGHLSILKFVGTGFRATLEKTEAGKEYLSLRVGYCVPIPVKIPAGIKVTVPLPHRVIIEGVDKQKVKLLAATIRKHRPPEPYKGKGIFVDNETIKLKNRKIK